MTADLYCSSGVAYRQDSSSNCGIAQFDGTEDLSMEKLSPDGKDILHSTKLVEWIGIYPKIIEGFFFICVRLRRTHIKKDTLQIMELVLNLFHQLRYF
jgi:hypothetical protein